MKANLNQSALTRLLVLNDDAHELERQLGRLLVISDLGQTPGGCRVNPVADYQNEIDQIARASLATCWLGDSDPD